ncbi:MAG: TldD/PmbA family protein, partial [Candidatus Alkanophagales archaeon]
MAVCGFDPEKLIRHARKLDLDLELYMVSRRGVLISFEDGRRVVGRDEEAGVSIRVVKDKKLGHYSFPLNSGVDERVALERAVKMASAGVRVKRPPFTFTDSVTEVSGLYDPVESMDFEEGVRLCEDCMRAMRGVLRGGFPRRGVKLSLHLSSAVEEVTVMNTYGIEKRDRATYYSFRASCVAGGGRGREGVVKRRFSDLDPVELAEYVAETAVETVPSDVVQEGRADVILHPKVLSCILNDAFVPCICADVAGALPMRDKVDRMVFSEQISVTDDGTLPALAFSARFDDEGWPTQRNAIVEKGVFKGFLYDNLSAMLNETLSTGNARREHYTAGVTVKPHNLLVEAGDYDMEELFEECDGIFVMDALSAAKPASGEIDLEVLSALRVEGGELGSALHPFHIKTSLQHVLGRVAGVSDVREETPGYICPYVLVKNV